MSDDRTVRNITDAKVLAAVSHPLRRRMMDILLLDGPATASTLAERTDQAVGNISHHLRTLATSDLVEEVPELARDRRERWWRLVSQKIRWSSTDFVGDPSAEAIERAAASINLDRQTGHVRAWSTVSAADREWWGEGPFAVNSWMRLSAEELEEVAEEVIELLDRWRDRQIPDDGQERRPVLVFAHGVPAKP